MAVQLNRGDGMRGIPFVAVAGAIAWAILGSSPATATMAPSTGQVVVIQAVPGASIEVSIDGDPVRSGVEVGSILGPFDLAPGPHSLDFSDASGEVAMSSSIDVTAGASSDVVLHRPAAVGGDPVVNTYATPLDPIGPGKARVLIAHTATVAPADVEVDGTTVFTNIANGEYAEADVPAGDHEVSVLPTGTTGQPILGPLDVTLTPRTVTMVYAVGRPQNGSMDVIVHTARLAADGTVAPDTIDTGSAGLAADVAVAPFGSPASRAPAAGVWWGLGALLAALLVAGTARLGLPLSRQRGARVGAGAHRLRE